jgi:hypothetical protein
MVGHLYIFNSDDMRKRICNILLLVAVLILADILVGVISKAIINKVSREPIARYAALIAYKFQSVKADVVIVGSSTANSHYIPSTFADSLSNLYGEKLIGFNAGAQNQGIPYCKAILSGVFERCHPKMVVMDIQPGQLFQPLSELQKKDFRPYYHYNENVKKILDDNSSFMGKVELMSNMYCENCEIIKLLFALRTFGKNSSSDVTGFERRDEILDKMPALSTIPVDKEAKPTCTNDLLDIVTMCSANNCDLVLVISPYLNGEYSSSYYEDYLKSLCEKNEIRLLDYMNDESFQDYKLFRDARHLNYSGAQVLSQRVCSDIRKLMSQD